MQGITKQAINKWFENNNIEALRVAAELNNVYVDNLITRAIEEYVLRHEGKGIRKIVCGLQALDSQPRERILNNVHGWARSILTRYFPIEEEHAIRYNIR